MLAVYLGTLAFGALLILASLFGAGHDADRGGDTDANQRGRIHGGRLYARPTAPCHLRNCRSQKNRRDFAI